MKFLLSLLVLFSPMFIVYSDDSTINFNNIFKNTRIGLFVNQDFDKLNGVYTSLMSIHDSNQLELVNFNIGYIENIDTDKNAPLIQVAFRADSLVKKLAGSSWSQKHANYSELPQIEFGPFYSVLIEKKDAGGLVLNKNYGVGLAIRL